MTICSVLFSAVSCWNQLWAVMSWLNNSISHNPAMVWADWKCFNPTAKKRWTWQRQLCAPTTLGITFVYNAGWCCCSSHIHGKVRNHGILKVRRRKCLVIGLVMWFYWIPTTSVFVSRTWWRVRWSECTAGHWRSGTLSCSSSLCLQLQGWALIDICRWSVTYWTWRWGLLIDTDLFSSQSECLHGSNWCSHFSVWRSSVISGAAP